MKTQDLIRNYDSYVMSTYARLPVALMTGKGARVQDSTGKEYLDFFPGWAVSGLGHCHPTVVKALKKQLSRIMHVSNNFYNELQGELAKVISKNSINGKVFFGNSGAEANEAMIKLSRRYGGSKRFEIISMEGSFHGRTLATVALTGQSKYNKAFEPLPRGFKKVPFNDIKAIKEAITKKTVAIVLELIQGEGGINIASKGYIKALRNLCTKNDILLIFDEVQTGIGRTGKMFCFEHYGIEPDMITIAKSLGGGFPIGPLVAKNSVADMFTPGLHASTFGGSPLACSCALATFKAIKEGSLLSNAEHMGKYLFEKLSSLKKKYSFIKDIRGIGLMIGLELSRPGKSIVDACMEEGLLINCTQEKILRFLPPITITKKQIDKGMVLFENALLKHL